MDISLPSDLEQFVTDEIRSGHFDTREEVINAAIAQLRDSQKLSREDLEEIRAAIDIGIAEADREEFVQFTAEDIIAEGHSRKAGKKAS
jgi:antitoxin ParD1/3/4